MPSALKAIEMVHDVDPRQQIMDELSDLVNEIEPLGARIVVAVYKRPEKSAGGILLTENYRSEDNYQGKVGLVMKLGRLAFQEDSSHQWGGRVPKVGDWVGFRVGDTHPFLLGKRTCRFVEDVNVQMILQRPDAVL